MCCIAEISGWVRDKPLLHIRLYLWDIISWRNLQDNMLHISASILIWYLNAFTNLINSNKDVFLSHKPQKVNLNDFLYIHKGLLEYSIVIGWKVTRKPRGIPCKHHKQTSCSWDWIRNPETMRKQTKLQYNDNCSNSIMAYRNKTNYEANSMWQQTPTLWDSQCIFRWLLQFPDQQQLYMYACVCVCLHYRFSFSPVQK